MLVSIKNYHKYLNNCCYYYYYHHHHHHRRRRRRRHCHILQILCVLLRIMA